MLEILPAEEVWTILQYYHCPLCFRQLRNHTSTERQTCHDAITSVTLTRKAREQQLLRPTEQKNSNCRRFQYK